MVQGLIERGEANPGITLGVLGGVVVLLLFVVFRLLFGGKKMKLSKKVK